MICFGWRLCISHIHRERNTDAFANLTCELEFEFMMFEQPPDCCNFLGPVYAKKKKERERDERYT